MLLRYVDGFIFTRLVRCCIFFLALFLFPSIALSQTPNANSQTWTTDGKVNDIAFGADGTVYLGGTFARVGAPTGTGVPISTSTGLALSSYPKVNGTIETVVSDGTGGWFIGGQFTAVGGVTRNRLAHINSDGTLDADWNPNANSTVTTMLRNGSTLYVAGIFSTIGGASRSKLAALSTTTGLATSWSPSTSGAITIDALAISGSTIYVGGFFTSFGGQSRTGLAAIDTDGNITSWNPDLNNIGIAKAIVVIGSTIYVGGTFTTVNGGTTRNRLAAFNNTDGTATSWNPNASYTVHALAASGSTLYVGGTFTTVNGGTSRRRLAAFDTSSGTPDVATAWDPNSMSGVYSMTLSGTNLYVAGGFSSIGTIGGQSRNRLAVIDTSTGNAGAWDPGANETVRAIALSGSNIYAGGTFNLIGGTERNRIAAINPATGEATSWNPNANGEVMTLLVNGSTLYTGGEFTTIGGQSRGKIAALSTSTGLATSWDPNANINVQALALSGSTLYVGGAFISIGGQSRNRLAALSTSTGLANSWDPNPNGTVQTIAVSGSSVYVGGWFTDVNSGTVRNRAAAFDSDGVATSWNPNMDNWVSSIVVSGSTIYVGGRFDNVNGGTARSRLASFDTGGIVTSWDPNSNATINAMALSGSTLYVGGGFSSVGGASRNKLAAVSASTGSATSWDPGLGTSSSVFAIAINGSTVYAGGEMSDDSPTINYFVRYGETIHFTDTTANAAENAGSVNIGLTLSAALPGNATVNYTLSGTATGGGSDYTLANGTATITAGNTTTNISVSVVNDSAFETSETIILTLSSPGNADLGENSIYTLTITDNDSAPTITLSPSTGTLAENGGTRSITATLSFAAVGTCTVTLAFSGTATLATDYTRSATSIAITNGNSTGTVTLTGVNETVDDDDETIIVDVTTATNCTESGTQRSTITITDDDTASSSSSNNSNDNNSNSTNNTGTTLGGGTFTEVGGDGFTVTAINFITDQVCGTATSDASGNYSLTLDLAKAVDPSDPTKLRVVITAVLGNVTIQKYIEGGTTGTSIAGGNADVNDTFAMQMLKDKIAQVGFSAIYDNSFAPNAFHGFMTNLFSTASPDDSGVAGSMAGGREIIKCLMAGGHSPFEFGFASWPNGISRITSGVLTSSEIEALVIAGDVYCSLNESSLRTRLEGMRDSMPSIGNFANQHIAGNKTTSDNILANSDEMSSYTNVVHGMNINKIKNGFGSLGGAIVRSVERARSQGNYSSMTDRNRAHVFAQAIEDDNFDPDDQEGAAVMMQMIEGLDLSGEISSTALEQYGAIIGGAVGGANTSTFQQMQSNPGLYSNYFVNQYDSNQIDDPNDITDNIDGIAGNVESNRISIEECLQQPGSSNTSCFENHSLDDWGY